ncbi:cytoplasmic dynein 2 light intermediate chain 1 [Glossina fuscipes]|uniref:Cytoplasmic dynein 2 light intermediate chain 1 n=1 Tax=Glossina fuscipes TaxID=7396 RepID=A0A8U0W9T5_9MUSC|nr:cytoplasmic dynein 2 light intermediate chain 1 [Glossina fuscipes]
MFNTITDDSHVKSETIQDVAFKLVEKQLGQLQQQRESKGRSILLLGSGGVGKSTIINKFLDRDENPRPTLALQFSYGRRSRSSEYGQKQVLNIWEVGSLRNTEQLVEVTLKGQNLSTFAVIIMIDLSQPHCMFADIEKAYGHLRDILSKLSANSEKLITKKTTAMTVEKIPFPVVIVGGKYDLYMNFEPEIKKQVCRCLRSTAHLIGAALFFYSSTTQKFVKTLRDTIIYLGFGSTSRPFRLQTTDYNDALSIWFGTDSWEDINRGEVLENLQQINENFSSKVPQHPSLNDDSMSSANSEHAIVNPSKDPGFYESVIDEMRAQKDEELQQIVRDTKLRHKFETLSDHA